MSNQDQKVSELNPQPSELWRDVQSSELFGLYFAEMRVIRATHIHSRCLCLCGHAGSHVSMRTAPITISYTFFLINFITVSKNFYCPNPVKNEKTLIVLFFPKMRKLKG